MTHAYNSIYLHNAARAIGNMLHAAVLVYGYTGDAFLRLFIQSDVAAQIEAGNPKYIAGRSGLELFIEVMEKTTGEKIQVISVETYDYSDVYWVGWVLAHYQWYSARSFRDILTTVPYEILQNLYYPLHEADVQKFYSVIDAQFAHSKSKLKTARQRCTLTQTELSEISGVSLPAIRAYERRAKDINKAQADTVQRLATALHCNISDLLD